MKRPLSPPLPGEVVGTLEARQGFALPVAVFSLVLVGVLVTGGFYMSRQEIRIGIASERSSTAFYLAERGVNDVLEGWDAARFGSMGVQQSDTISDTLADGHYDVQVTRLSETMYFLESEGTAGWGGPPGRSSSRRVGTMAKVRALELLRPAALTARNGLEIAGSAHVSGSDTIPESLREVCGAQALADVPGVLVDRASAVRIQASGAGVTGSRRIVEDPELTEDLLLTFGGLSWEELTSLATIVHGDGALLTAIRPDSVLESGSWVCDTDHLSNWGDPLNPRGVCGDHLPVVHLQGEATIRGDGLGQGVLLVEGDLEVEAGFTFYGPVVVRGGVRATGGPRVVGRLIAASGGREPVRVLGEARVQYSSCAIRRAIESVSSLAAPAPLKERSWVDLSSPER